MIIVDNALRKRAEEGRPVRVAILGAGFMCQGLSNQIVNSVPGIRLVAIYNRRGSRAKEVWAYAGRADAVEATTQNAFDDAARAGKPIFTEDAMLIARSEHVDVIVDTTGSVEFGAQHAGRCVPTQLTEHWLPRPERRRTSIDPAASADHGEPSASGRARDLVTEPRLADPGLARDHHQYAPPVGRRRQYGH